MIARKITITLSALALTLVTIATLVWIGLQPPALPVPPRGTFTIRNVTVVNPGVDRQERVDIAVADGRVRGIALQSRYAKSSGK